MDAIITFDMDNIGCNGRTYEMNNISFNYEKELNKLYNYFSSKSIKNLTAFVRIDNQIKELFGDYLYVLNLLRRSNLQCEIGWHPHLYAKNGKYRLLTDSHLACQQLLDIYDKNKEVQEMNVVRLGGAQMDNNIMTTLNNMNFTVDSTAIPGSLRNDQYRKINWSITGNDPYQPSVSDYRCAGEPCHQIIEMPMTTIPICAPYDKEPKKRYINPTMRKEIFQPAFSASCNQLDHVVVVFHPDQLIAGYQDDLYEYGFDNFVDNFEFIIEKLGNVNFKTISSYISHAF